MSKEKSYIGIMEIDSNLRSELYDMMYSQVILEDVDVVHNREDFDQLMEDGLREELQQRLDEFYDFMNDKLVVDDDDYYNLLIDHMTN